MKLMSDDFKLFIKIFGAGVVAGIILTVTVSVAIMAWVI